MSTESKSSQQLDFQFKFLNDRYIIIKKLGKGGHASVWLTYDSVTKKYYALKIGNIDYYEENVLETSILKKLSHCKYLVDCASCFDYKSELGTHHCNVMELMGGTILDYIKRNKTINIDVIVNFVKQLLIGIETLHSNNIIHGDIKPENILISCPSNKIQNLINKLNLDELINGSVLPQKEQKREIILNRIKQILNECEESTDKKNNECVSDEEDWETCSNTYSDSTDSDNVYSDDDMNSSLFTISSDGSHDDSESDSCSESDSLHDITNQINIDVKLTDMSSCIVKNNFPEKKLDTQYYRAPELLLRLPYDESSDMWAFGCTIYEMLTRTLLFDPDEYDRNKRYHLYLITQKLGQIPTELIEKSKNRDVYFTHNMKKIKGFHKIYNDDLSIELRSFFEKYYKDNQHQTCQNTKLIDVILGCLKMNSCERLTAKEALALLNGV